MSAPSYPMEGVRVLETATFIAAPFCGTILSDFGAEIIKIEQPRVGDPLRQFGTPSECSDTFAWLSEARNKKSVTLDLRVEEGAEIFRALVRASDVVLENFRPGTMESWGVGYEDLKKINPKLVMLRVSAYGQTGPMRDMPGFARVAHAFSGLSHLAGMPDGPPVVPGSTSLADYCSGMWGAIGVLMALRVAERTGEGQYIDIGLYESIFRLLDELAPAYQKTGAVRSRMGGDVPHVVPHGHWLAKDGKWIALACSSDKIFARFAAMIGRPDLASPDAYPTGQARVAGRAVVNRAVADWVANLPAAEAIERCNAAGVPCGPILDIGEIFENPQYRARENLTKVQDPRVGEIVVPSGMPRLSATPPILQFLGRPLGADTATVLNDVLGLDRGALDALARKRVV